MNTATDKVYKSLVTSYLRPPQNDFRKCLAILLGKTRAFKHRVQILTETEKQRVREITAIIILGYKDDQLLPP